MDRIYYMFVKIWPQGAKSMYMVICNLNIFSSETTWSIKTFHMKPSCKGEINVYINDPGHMTKMAAKAKHTKIL